MKKIIIICICIAIICSCLFTTTKAGFVSHLKCVACKKLGPLAGSRVCKFQCEKLDIFPETCAKLCTWMITKHPETSCKLAKLCPSRLTQDEGQFDIGDDEGYYGDNEEEYYENNQYDSNGFTYRNAPTYNDEDDFEDNADMIDYFDNFKWYGNWCGPGWTGGEYISAKEYVQQHKSAFYPCIDKVDCACRTHDYACAASSVGCCEADDEALEFIAKKYGKTWKARRVGTAMSFSKSRRKC